MMCDIPKCKKDDEYVYYGKNICERCWYKHCDGKINLKKIFKIKEQTINKCKICKKDITTSDILKADGKLCAECLEKSLN